MVRRQRLHRGRWPNAASGHTCAPLWRWTTTDVLAWLAVNDVPLCPIYQRLADIGCPGLEQRVGFVFGGRGGPARYRWLRRGWPHLWTEYITRWPHLTDLTDPGDR